MKISFFVSGNPKPQLRPRAFARRIGNRFAARVYNPATAEGWKSQVAVAAKWHLPPVPITVSIHLSLCFVFDRPKAHYGTGRNARVRKPSAPLWHTIKPDCDNLAKAVIDALVQIGMFKDDGLIYRLEVRKVYTAEEAPRAGCWIDLRSFEGSEWLSDSAPRHVLD